MTRLNANETLSGEGPQCPFCENQITADDACFYDEMNYTHETCDACGETFNVSVDIDTTWECSKPSPNCEGKD